MSRSNDSYMHLRFWNSLRFRIYGVSIVLVVLMLAAGWFFWKDQVDQVRTNLGEQLISKQTEVIRDKLRGALNNELSLSRDFAHSAILRRWAKSEQDPKLYADAMQELERFRQIFSSNSFFYVIDQSKHYYFNNQSNDYAGRELTKTLDVNKPADAWYFNTVEQVRDAAVNVDYGLTDQNVFVWINVPIYDVDHQLLGVAGTGLELQHFLRTYLQLTELGGENVLMDANLSIQAYRDHSHIDLQSINKDQHTSLQEVIPLNDLSGVKAAMDQLDQHSDSIQTVEVEVEGSSHWIAVGLLPTLRLYVLTTLDQQSLIGNEQFFPVMKIILVLMLAVALILVWVVEALLMNRLRGLYNGIASTDESGVMVKPVVMGGRDELGVVIKAFVDMTQRLHGHAEVLQSKVDERTQQLAARLVEVESLQKNLRDQAIRDSLTGLYNRRYFDETVSREIVRSDRGNESLSLLMLDVDHFKSINDRFGHAAGDHALQQIAYLLEDYTRRTDIVFRWGGEEFVVVMPTTGREGAFKLAESLRAAVEQLSLSFNEDAWQMTLSVGVAVYPLDGVSVDELLLIADNHLYQAKEGGRNRVEPSSLI
ncbi:MAG: diguanylate cyclase [Zetaproteobacteria bacterium]|nr:diguanylate cyclase [Zetaproteobacteria bacterium]